MIKVLYLFGLICLVYCSAISHYNGFEKLYKADSEENVEMILALKQRNLDLLDDLFWSVSDPQSDKYGKYRTLDEVNELTSPTDDSVSRVLSFIKSTGGQVDYMTRNGDFIQVSMRVADVEKAFSAEMHHFYRVDRFGYDC
jgi:tripeptidyl-peptidase-1